MAKFSHLKRDWQNMKWPLRSAGNARLMHRSENPATSATSLILNELTRYTLRYRPATCSGFAPPNRISFMAAAAWRPKSRRHSPRFYSTENIEDPFAEATARQVSLDLPRIPTLGVFSRNTVTTRCQQVTCATLEILAFRQSRQSPEPRMDSGEQLSGRRRKPSLPASPVA
jgi:hypothetical protein